ncbi:MAG: hypothetical protein ACT4TC_13000 [Myxococcaceae bacterium]
MASNRQLNFRRAFLHPLNLLGLVVGGVASAVTQEPALLLATLGAESVVLGVATQVRLTRALRRDGPLEEDAETLLDELAPSQREHYFALRDLKERILGNYRKLPGGRVLAASSEQRVDSLLVAFLRLLSTLNSYRTFLNATDRKALERELGGLKMDADGETNPKLREVKWKRVEILTKRVQRFEQADESREVVSHQLAGIEDLLRLTHEQSIAIRDPESVSRQLELLSAEVQSTEETVRELESFMELTAEAGVSPPVPTRVR